MKVLCITRKYPPSRGGMETFSFELLNRLSEDSVQITESGKNILLSTMLLFVRSLRSIRKVDVIHIGDGVLSPLGAVLHLLSKKPVVVTIHGLELTSAFGGRFYHVCMRWSLKKIARVVVVSQATESIAEYYGIPKERIALIPHGVEHHAYSSEQRTRARWYIEKLYPQTQRHPLILSVGRLVERKGIAWFISTVFPNLPADAILCVVSDGPERARIQQLITTLNMTHRIFLIGKVPPEELEHWYCAADIFVFPNIPVPYDIEGFGLTPLEAASYGTVVIASRLEGITTAIIDGKNGTLVPALDSEAWIRALNALLAHITTLPEMGENATRYTIEHYSWDTVANDYRTLFSTL